jgi:transcription elongation GreA/GreB family factor
MSRAFVKELERDTINLPDRPISPHPNFVTEAGGSAIENALHRFEAAHKAAVAKGDERGAAGALREMRYWSARLASAQTVNAQAVNARAVEPSGDDGRARFGASVTVRREGGREQTFRIVGEDEANPSRGTVSHVAPFVRAVLGHAVGETVEIAGQDAVILKIS